MKHTHIEIRDVGQTVICDSCNGDYTRSSAQGGLLFGSNAYCPICAEIHLPKIKSYGEEWYIRARCPDGMTFRDWVLNLRDGNNEIKIITTSNEP